MSKNIITITATIQKKSGITGLEKPIIARVFCKDQYAIATFSDKNFAKKLAKVESRAGKDVAYDPNLNVLVEKFKNKTAKEVAEIIGKQMKKSGGVLQ